MPPSFYPLVLSLLNFDFITHQLYFSYLLPRRIHTHTYTYTNTHIHAYIQTLALSHSRTYTHTYTNTHIRTGTYCPPSTTFPLACPLGYIGFSTANGTLSSLGSFATGSLFYDINIPLFRELGYQYLWN